MSKKRASAFFMIMSSCKRGNEPFWGAGKGSMATSCTVMKEEVVLPWLVFLWVNVYLGMADQAFKSHNANASQPLGTLGRVKCL